MGTVFISGDAVREYPTSITVPRRKMRKSQRKKIFQENSEAMQVAKELRRTAKKETNG